MGQGVTYRTFHNLTNTSRCGMEGNPPKNPKHLSALLNLDNYNCCWWYAASVGAAPVYCLLLISEEVYLRQVGFSLEVFIW